LVNKKPINTQEIYLVLPRLKEVYARRLRMPLDQGFSHSDTFEVFNKSRAF
jgi:hypothetical protein